MAFGGHVDDLPGTTVICRKALSLISRPPTLKFLAEIAICRDSRSSAAFAESLGLASAAQVKSVHSGLEIVTTATALD